MKLSELIPSLHKASKILYKVEPTATQSQRNPIIIKPSQLAVNRITHMETRSRHRRRMLRSLHLLIGMMLISYYAQALTSYRNHRPSKSSSGQEFSRRSTVLQVLDPTGGLLLRNNGINITYEPTHTSPHDSLTSIDGHQKNSQIQVKSELTSSKTTMRSHWRRRYARSFSEGIRREKTFESLIKKAQMESFHGDRHYFARTIAGIICALAEEVDGLSVQVNSERDSPFWEKRINSIEINFSRLAFQALRLGGLHSNITTNQAAPLSSQNRTRTSKQRKKQSQAKRSELSKIRSANEAFDSMDKDNSGTLDQAEIAQALNIATASNSDQTVLSKLASKLVDMYDTNGDGVVDFEEYQLMVNDMAVIRMKQMSRIQQDSDGQGTKQAWWAKLGRSAMNSTNNDKDKSLPNFLGYEDSFSQKGEQVTGSITFRDLKLDLRQLLFGSVPWVKRITPGGPLVLEPFTCTVQGSLSKKDVMESTLVDMGLRRLVARALRRRMGSVRDIMDGAIFYGRSWNMASREAPLIEVPRLIEVDFDSSDRLIITGRAIIRTSPYSPIIENAFKVRTRIGTRKNGQVIRLEQPELALVLECPSYWEESIKSICDICNWTAPPKPKPLYSFFPIYSPFKVEDNDGFDLGPDNRIKSLYIKDSALRFEMESTFRPGRFLGSHYIAFTIPIRTFLITIDRVMNGIRAARRNKRNLMRKTDHDQRQGDSDSTSLDDQDEFDNTTDSRGTMRFFNFKEKFQMAPNKVQKSKKSFFSRFVEGYSGVGESVELRSKRLTLAISDWFGRQGIDSESSQSTTENVAARSFPKEKD